MHTPFFRTLSLLCLLLLTGFLQRAPAITFGTTNSFLVASNTTHSGELWISSTNAIIHGTLEDPFFVTARHLDLSGIAEDDVWAMVETLTASGTAQHRLRAMASKSITINGRVNKGLMALGNTVQLENTAETSGDLLLVGEHVIFEGAHDGDATIYGVNVTISGQVTGTLKVKAMDIVLLPGASISSNLVYEMPKDLILSKNIQVGGELIKKLPEPPPPLIQQARNKLTFTAYFFAAALLVGIPFLALFPKWTAKSVLLVRTVPGRCAMVGFATLGLLPLLAISAFFLQVGIPLSLVLASATGILVYLGKIVVALAVGSLILRKRGALPFAQVVLVMAVGLLAIYVATALPLVSLFAWMMVAFIGTGSLVLSAMDGQRQIPVINLSPELDENEASDQELSKNQTDVNQQTKE